MSATTGTKNLQKYQAQIRTFQQKQVDAQQKVKELKAQIDDIEKSCLSRLQIVARIVIAAITVVVAGALLALVANPLLTGLVLGVIAFVVVGYFLYQKNRSRQTQIEILQQLVKAQGTLDDANSELAAACSHLFGMKIHVNEQWELITGQGKTVEEQLKQLTEQATKISTLEQNNAKLKQILQAIQQARAEAEKKYKK